MVSDGTSAVEVRPLPFLEEFAAFLFSNPDGEAGHTKRRLLIAYATERAKFEGEPVWEAIEQAHELADEAMRTADERWAEATL